MRKTRYDAYAAACPTRQTLDRIADKWTVLVIGLLERRPHRFGELRRGIDGVSQKMLTQTLRSLERDGLVSRRAQATVPVTVEYSLTPTGRTLAEPLDAIRRWAERHIEEVLAARSRHGEGSGSRTSGQFREQPRSAGPLAGNHGPASSGRAGGRGGR